MLNFVCISLSFDWPTIIISGLVGALLSWFLTLLISFLKSSSRKTQIITCRIEEKSFYSLSSDCIKVQVTFNGVECDRGLTVLRFALINHSNSSLNYENNFDEPVLIKSDKYDILDAGVLNPMPTRSKVWVDDNGKVHIKWGLWKKGESIRLRLIGRPLSGETGGLDSDVSFYDSLKYNLRSDSVENVVSNRPSLKKLIISLFLILLFCFCLQYCFIAKDSSNRLYSFDYSGESVTGVLEYNEEKDSFIICLPDSSNTASQLFSLKKHPRIIVSNTIGEGIFLLILYGSMFFLLSGICIFLSYIANQKDKNKMFSENYDNANNSNDLEE